jgi:hypothetical protein
MLDESAHDIETNANQTDHQEMTNLEELVQRGQMQYNKWNPEDKRKQQNKIQPVQTSRIK